MKKSEIKKNIFSQERIEIDFMNSEEKFPMTLGRVKYSRAHSPLLPHIHKDSIEIVYVEKGRQIYTVDNTEFLIQSGEFFLTFANELHGTSDFPEEKSLFYFLIINIDKLKNGFLGYDAKDGELIAQTLLGIKSRVFKAKTNYRSSLDRIITGYYSDSRYLKTTIRNVISDYIIGVAESANESFASGSQGMQHVINYIDEHIEDDISVTALSRLTTLSVSGFKSKFRQQFGIPPAEYVLSRKVEYAKKLLRYTDRSVTDIAFTLSFSSSQYFSTVFKRFTSRSPTSYRKCNS